MITSVANMHAVSAPAVNTGAPPKIKISQTFQGFLSDTLANRIQWKRRSQKEAGVYADSFEASRNGINLELKAAHPVADGSSIPTRIVDWEARLTTDGKSPKILDGPSMVLPETVNTTTPVDVQTLPKLFRMAYEAMSSVFGDFAPMIQQLTDKLRLRDSAVETSYSFIKPSLAYPAFGSGSVMQIVDRDQNLKVEITRFGGESQVTLRHGNETTKLRKMALENPVLFGAVDELVKEANFQRTNNPDLGIEA